MNNIETVTLDNGLRIFLYKDERRHKTFFTYITLGGGQRKNFILTCAHSTTWLKINKCLL